MDWKQIRETLKWQHGHSYHSVLGKTSVQFTCWDCGKDLEQAEYGDHCWTCMAKFCKQCWGNSGNSGFRHEYKHHGENMAQQKKIVTVTKATHTLSGFSRYKAQWYVSGSAATPYTVSELRNGDWECSCRAWTRNHPREDCKHIMRVKLQENTPAPALTMASTPSLAVPIYTGRKMRD